MNFNRWAPSLPYDIQLEVIEFALDDISDPEERSRALATFSLISAPLCIFCQRKIIRQFTVGTAGTYKQQLILASNPSLCLYIKELRFFFNDLANVLRNGHI